MTTYHNRIISYLARHKRTVSGGGIAWHRGIFTRACALRPQDLIDAAVDMAWMRLRSKAATALEIKQEREWIVFRVQACSV